LTYFYVVSAGDHQWESADSAPVSAIPILDLNLGFEKTRVITINTVPWRGLDLSGGTNNGSDFWPTAVLFESECSEGTQAAFVQKYGTLSQTIRGSHRNDLHDELFRSATSASKPAWRSIVGCEN